MNSDERLMRIRLLVSWMTILILGGSWSGARAAQAESAEPLPTPETFSLGKRIYDRHCSACHGSGGRGDGPAAFLLYPKPRDFTKNEYRLVSTNDMQATDEDLFKTISRGMPGSAMPSWSHLGENERWALVRYVRYLTELDRFKQTGEVTEETARRGIPWPTLQKMLTRETDPESRVRPTPEPEVTAERLRRGQELFAKGCAACHGPLGKGDGQQSMKDSAGLPIRPRDLTAGIFKGSSKSEDLYHRIAAGIPGSPMPGYQSAFQDEEIWNLIHYIQTLSSPDAEKRSRVERLRFVAGKTRQVPTDPLDESWAEASPAFVVLMPLWWRDERIEGLEARALHDGRRIAIRLSWKDATRDDSNVAIQSFSDGVAVQWSDDADPPTFAMGSADGFVTIWHWKAAWQEDLAGWKDIETTYPHAAVDWYEAQKNYAHGSPVEMADTQTRFHDPRFLTGWGAGNPLSDPERTSAGEGSVAKGVGTLTVQRSTVEPVEARGAWKDGTWQVIFARDLKPVDKKALEFEAGRPLNVAFAAWDGSKRDRNGQKSVSIWNELILEQ